ncbi:hypothetical protein [Paractinoplanes lichenicola]|uniref:Uncharacterized protein n=1 Tax=Paractinoplanes lichenicola TaxID=2802976 RepID=A0ABS1VH85_9ACTN|nr:hypothetical protein [Actinoplanes lichenicola]MBL7254043.1 hypothetical protein [Actinoplanes lichenicola]
MTAPGDSVLIFILLALFVACCGYAAGRVHQRRQLKQDRDEAYRDGYETASNRVFSLAVRTTVPKRSPDADPGRAVRHQGVAPATAPQAAAHVPSEPPASDPTDRRPRQRSSAESTRHGMALGFPAPPPPPPNTVAEPGAVGGVNYQPFPVPRHPDLPAPPPLPDTDPAAPPPLPDTDPVRLAEAGRPTPAEPTRHLPEPAPHSRSVNPEPGSPANLSRTGGYVSRAAGDQDEPEDEPRSVGKHTVPDELVQATTYRLPPDRVFRAKVPNSTALPDEPTTNLGVPKPRRS